MGKKIGVFWTILFGLGISEVVQGFGLTLLYEGDTYAVSTIELTNFTKLSISSIFICFMLCVFNGAPKFIYGRKVNSSVKLS